MSSLKNEQNKRSSMNLIKTIRILRNTRPQWLCVSAAKPRKVDGDEREKLRGHNPLSPGDHLVQNGHGLSSGEPFGPQSVSKEMIGGNPTTSVPSSIFQPWFRMAPVNLSNSLSTSLICGPNVVDFATLSGFPSVAISLAISHACSHPLR
jgi:hypothetical protein